jgi:hypothetical protein
MANKKFLEKFEIILDDQVGIYGIVMDKVRFELGLTDDRAVQAAAFTIWKQTMSTIGSLSPDVMFWVPSDDPAENLKNFEQYAAWYGARSNAFIDLCEAKHDLDEETVRAVMRSIEFTQAMFDKVKDFDALSDIVNLTADILVGQVDEEDEKVLEEIGILNAKVFGQKIGKSVDEILGGVE